jgi:hypothetical protein
MAPGLVLVGLGQGERELPQPLGQIVQIRHEASLTVSFGGGLSVEKL